MKETSNDIGKKLLEFVRLIVFIPAGFLAGQIMEYPLRLIGLLGQNIFDTWMMGSLGIHIFVTLGIYSAVFISSAKIKPNFLKPRFFLFFWIIILTVLAIGSLLIASKTSNPDLLRFKSLINAFAPFGVLIYLIKDENNDYLMFNKKKNE